MVINSCLQKNPISKLQEFAQQGRIFSPKYEDLTPAEGHPGYRFVVQVYTRSKVPANNENSQYTRSRHHVPDTYNLFYQSYGNYQYKDYTCKGYGSSKKEAKVNAAAKLMSLLWGVKNPYPTIYNENDLNGDEKKKNPISVIQEYSSRNRLKPNYIDSIANGMFHCRLILGTVDTSGQGMNKRSAKVIAAARMLKILENIKEGDDKLKPLTAGTDKPKTKQRTKSGARRNGTSNAKSESEKEDDIVLNNNEKLFDLDTEKHPISLLQEFCQKRALQLPVYHRKGIFTTRFTSSRIKIPNFDFLITISISGKEYFASGSGTKIKNAKTAAAQNMIARLEEVKEQIVFTKTPKVKAVVEEKQTEKQGTTTPPEVTEKVTEKSKIAEVDPDGTMNALALVNQLFNPTISVEETPDKPDHRKEFKVTLKVEEEEYTGTANSKKKAKLMAAAACLEDKAGHSQYNTTAMNQSWSAAEFSQSELGFAKTVSNLVQQKYDLVTKDLQEHEQKRKVLAGILIRSSDKPEVGAADDLQVLVVTSGTKCVDGDSLCSNGQVLNDSHAEILARRAFKRFLLEQVKRHHNSDTSILVKSTTAPFLLTVKPGLSFHLYISTAPCGDARIYTPNNKTNGIDQDPGSTKKMRGLLRSKIECGEGTIPVTNMNPIQTWDGVLAGERLCTMSCSDKLAVWNVLGIQGAMLTHFIKPVYFDTLTIGGCFSLYHITRALSNRVEGCDGLPDCVKINRPLLLPVSQQEQRVPSKSSGYSVNWILGDGNVEVTKTNSGRCLDESPSRLCKNSLFNKFNDVCHSVTGKLPYKGRLYLDIKTDAGDYQLAKKKVFENFKKSGFGNWIRKPIEQNMFSV